MNYIRYLRDDRRVPHGVFVCLEDGRVGFSACGPRDRFTKRRALQIAMGRADKEHVDRLTDGFVLFDRMPRAIKNELRDEIERALRWWRSRHGTG